MDHYRATIQDSQISCGIMQVHGITDAAGAVYQLASRLYHPSRGTPCAAVILSDVVNDDNNTTKFIKIMEDLGHSLYTTTIGENPKTGNMIYITTIVINHEMFKEWYRKERVRRLSKVGA